MKIKIQHLISNDGIVNKWVAGARGQWVQWRMISYINNYSDSINPPFNIYGYAFRGTQERRIRYGNLVWVKINEGFVERGIGNSGFCKEK